MAISECSYSGLAHCVDMVVCACVTHILADYEMWFVQLPGGVLVEAPPQNVLSANSVAFGAIGCWALLQVSTEMN